jgi:peptidoglycan/xylan/chitin deacetylase (PgdA/CDA1 family)
MTDSFIKHKLIPHICFRIPFFQQYESTQIRVTIPYYHMVNDHPVIYTKHLYPHKTIKQFNEDIDYLGKCYHPIQISDLLDHLKNGQSLPRKALLLTFDDGFREMHDIVAPILLQKGIPAAFFINSSFTDNCNFCFQHKASVIVEHLSQRGISNATQGRIRNLLGQNAIKETDIVFRMLAIKYDQRKLVDQIAEMLEMDFNSYLQRHQPYLTTKHIKQLISNGFTIGGHSIDHPLYANLSLDEQLRQTTESIRFVRDKFNLEYGAFAFPHSDNGVSRQYFDHIEKSGLVDISFGTSGMIEDCIPNHFQRFSLETPVQPAKYILAYQYAKRRWRNIKHVDRIIRN